MKISMDGRGRYQDNILLERLWRTVKYEEVYLKAYANGLEARRGLREYFRFYNHRRPHQALGYVRPAGDLGQGEPEGLLVEDVGPGGVGGDSHHLGPAGLEGLLAAPLGAGDDAGPLAAVLAGAGGGFQEVGEGHQDGSLLPHFGWFGPYPLAGLFPAATGWVFS